ncbi:TatD family hydrolase [Puniceicoccaceae bacterium K14]|nr:TatD family hydrolase [Puniceicoccaceae bacterium K14]
MKGIIDTHTHLESFILKGVLDETLKSAASSGLERLITVGTAEDDWDLYREVSAKHPHLIDFTVGIHPCSVEEGWEKQAEKIEGYFSGEVLPVALGEIGLDRFHLPKSDEVLAEEVFERQKAAFRSQLAIARRLDCPVVIHSRGAFDESVEVIDASGIDWKKVVFHCFSEGPGEMQKLLDRGGYGSFTGVITFKNAEGVREAAKLQGLDRLMVETDAPYLAPMPHRGKRNEPAFLAHTAAFCSELFAVTESEFSEKVGDTSQAFYGLR